MLDRRAVVRDLLANRGGLVCVAGLGGTAWDVAAAGDADLDLPLWGAMGGAAMLGLGLALAQPDRPVLVVTGDGEQLMALGALATIAAAQPANLTVVVLDNERYGETGMQRTHTAFGRRQVIQAKLQEPFAAVVFCPCVRQQRLHIRESQCDAHRRENSFLPHSATEQHITPPQHRVQWSNTRATDCLPPLLLESNRRMMTETRDDRN